MRRALARVFDATKAENRIPISGKDCLLMTQIAFFGDPARCAQKANGFADELEQRIADGVSVFPRGHEAHSYYWHAHGHSVHEARDRLFAKRCGAA